MSTQQKNNKNQPGVKKNSVWTSKRVDKWMKDYGEGVMHKDSPWLDNTIGVRNPSLIFEYTPEEIEELTRCASDIIYFANNYCYCLQGSRGYQPLKLRDYQEEMLSAYESKRFVVTVASRQIGKCSINSCINILDGNGNTCNTTIENVYMSNSKQSFLSKIKNYLYKLYHKL